MGGQVPLRRIALSDHWEWECTEAGRYCVNEKKMVYSLSSAAIRKNIAAGGNGNGYAQGDRTGM